MRPQVRAAPARYRRHALGDRLIAGAGDALGPGDLEADLALSHLEALGVGREQVRDLPGRRVVHPPARG